MRIRRLAALAVAASAAFAPAANAEQTILTEIIQNAMNGCYGVGVTVCDPHVSSNPTHFERTPVPVCVDTCTYYNVPVPGSSGDQLCVAWSDHTGAGTEVCSGDPWHR